MGVDIKTGFNNYIRCASGTAATPSISFSTDTNTGMYRAGADSIGFATGGAERFRISSTYASMTTTANKAYLNFTASTATTPAFTFNADTDTGLGRAGANVGSLIAGGASIAQFSSNGLSMQGLLGLNVATMTTAQKLMLPLITGSIIFDTNLGKLCICTGLGWETITSV